MINEEYLILSYLSWIIPLINPGNCCCATTAALIATKKHHEKSQPVPEHPNAEVTEKIAIVSLQTQLAFYKPVKSAKFEVVS